MFEIFDPAMAQEATEIAEAVEDSGVMDDVKGTAGQVAGGIAAAVGGAFAWWKIQDKKVKILTAAAAAFVVLIFLSMLFG